MPNIYITFVENKSKSQIKKFIAQRIRDVEKLGRANHVAIVVESDNIKDCVVFHSVFPRPISQTMKDFLILNEPVLMYKKEVRNQQLLFEIMMWLSIKATHAEYGLTENLLIFIKRTWSQLAEYINVIKVNHDSRLNCSEYAMRFLAWAWPNDFTLERNEDSLGLREVADVCNKQMLLLNQEQVNLIKLNNGHVG